MGDGTTFKHNKGYECIAKDCADDYLNEFEYCPQCWAGLPLANRQVLTGQEVRVVTTTIYNPPLRLWAVTLWATAVSVASAAAVAWWAVRHAGR